MLHVIGDSHVMHPYLQFLSQSQIHYYVGANMKNLGYPCVQGLPSWVAEINPQPTDVLVFVCGEIDIRVRAFTYMMERGKEPTEFLPLWVNRYLDKITLVPANGARIFIQSIAPPGPAAQIQSEDRSWWPVAGSDEARVKYTIIANTAMEAGCRDKGLAYLDVYSRHVGPDGMLNPLCTEDGVHIKEPTALQALLVEHGLL